MVTKKRATAKKAGKKAGKKAMKRGRKHTTTVDPLVGHSPIIITDGSASVEFSKSEYSHAGGGHHTSSGLRLDNVEARRNPASANPDHICHTFSGSTRHRIEAACMVGSVRTDIVIEGANSGSSANRSPTIKFDRDSHFREDSANFPPKHPAKGRRFGNAPARIISFRIINLSTNQIVHDCDFVQSGGFEYTINDAHA